jgi:hypothetical protein
MSGVQPHARDGALARRWRAFRRWRRSRPFWGGLFTLLGGVWIFGTTQLSLGGLSFQMGPSGFLSWLIPTILVASGLLLWFSLQQRMFYAIVAAVTAVYSLIGVNLGGFFIGMLLGLVGAALGFAWAPTVRPATPAPVAAAEPLDGAPVEEPADARTATMDDLFGDRPAHGEARTEDPAGPHTEPYTGPHTEPVVPATPHRPAIPDSGLPPESRGVAEPPDPPSGTHPGRLLAILLIVIGLSAAGTVALPGASPARAQPCPIQADEPTPTPETEPTKPAEEPAEPPAEEPEGEPVGQPPAPTAPPTAAPGDEGQPGGIVEGVIEGVRDLLGIGQQPAAPAATPTPTAGPDPAAKPAKPAAEPEPEAGPARKEPAGPARWETDPPAAKTMDDLAECTKADLQQPGPDTKAAAEPGQPRVARPSRLTGSRVSMFGLSYDGVAELPTADGTIRALKFSMDRSVTNDFELLTPAPNGATVLLKSSALSVEGNVQFYATRFSGELIGIRLTFTPDSPPPLTLPIMIFGDPDIQLAFVSCDRLGAPDLVVTPAG